MALDGIILAKITDQLQNIVNSRINKIYQITKTELIFNLRLPKKNLVLLISTHSLYNRIHLTKKKYPTPDYPSNFAMLLRKHLENGTIVSIKQYDYDRYLEIEITNHNEIGDKIKRYLFVELMGKYANVILCDEDRTILDALLRIPPYLNTQRIIQPGANYIYPIKQDKTDPFLAKNYQADLSFTSQFSGFSPLLDREFKYRISQGESFQNILKEVVASNDLYIYPKHKQYEYHIIELKHLNLSHKKLPLETGMDFIYTDLENQAQIKELTGDLVRVIKREIKKAERKLPKLEASFDDALDFEKYQVYGDLLFSYGQNIKKGNSQVTMPDFEGNSITIPLDLRYDGITNANKFYQRYHKLKNAQAHLLKQIELTKHDLEYFRNLDFQLKQATLLDAQEIRTELINYGYLKPPRRQKKTAPKNLNYITIQYDDNITILIGKNNLQNDYLTFNWARKSYYWFHVADYHGSHVIVNTNQLDEPLIRLAAMLAAYFSQSRDSSSIPVNYTEVRNIKKIPQTRLGFVALGQHKTIYIDVDEKVITSYLD